MSSRRVGAPCDSPESIATRHSFLSDDLLLRRRDDKLDVAGGFDASQVVFDSIEADGIRLPSRRRASTRGADYRPNLDPLMVFIDISKVRFS